MSDTYRCEWRAAIHFDVDQDTADRLSVHPVHMGPWVLGQVGSDVGVVITCRHCGRGFTPGECHCRSFVDDRFPWTAEAGRA